MLSGRLVHLIESHWDEIVTRVIAQIRREPNMTHMNRRAESELRDWAQKLLENLGHWLRAANEADLGTMFEKAGEVRFEEDVPLDETIRSFCILREKALDFVEEHLFPRNTMQVFEEEELERRLSRLFDHLTVHLAHGYEHALRMHAALRAHV